MIDNEKVLFSGMQATGNLTLGNYLGALKNWVKLSDEYLCFYSVVDLHSITVRQDPAELRKRARALLTLYIAAGIDPFKACIYFQSHVSGIMRKCKRAVTDSLAVVAYSDDQPGVKNLIDIYSSCTNKTPAEVEKEFEGKGYGDFKMAVGESVVSVLKPLQDRYYELSKDKAYIDKVIKENAEKADYYAQKTLRKVKKKVGFPEVPRI